jgi:hypothetical protein
LNNVARSPAIGSPEFNALRDHWYREANRCRCKPRCPGRCELAIDADPPDDGWTFSGGAGAKHSAHVSLDALDFDALECADQIQPLSATPRAEFWRQVGLAVNDLPRNYPRRAFLVALAESGNLSREAKRHGLTPWQGRWAFKKLLDRSGLTLSPMARDL